MTHLNWKDFALITLWGRGSTDVVVSTMKCWTSCFYILGDWWTFTSTPLLMSHWCRESSAITNVCAAVGLISTLKCFAALAKCITEQTLLVAQITGKSRHLCPSNYFANKNYIDYKHIFSDVCQDKLHYYYCS